MNIKNNVEGVRKNIMAPLDHMFGDRHLRDSKWCYKKHIEEDDTMSVDEKLKRMKVGYYMCKVEDRICTRNYARNMSFIPQRRRSSNASIILILK